MAFSAYLRRRGMKNCIFITYYFSLDNLAIEAHPSPTVVRFSSYNRATKGMGGTQGAQKVQKNTFGKYFTEPFLR